MDPEPIEPTEPTEPIEPTEPKWHDGYDEEALKTLGKYETQEDSNNGHVELAKKLGDAVHFPDEKTSDEDREKFHAKVAKYQGVPDTPDGYVVDKETLESPNLDKELLKSAREMFHKANAPQGTFTEAVKMWNGMMQARDKINDDFAKASEKEYRKELGDDFDVVVGKPGDEEHIGTIKQAAMRFSKILNLDYKDKDGNPRSQLVDCLELDRKDGRLGDKIAVLKTLQWAWENCFAQGKTFAGEPVSGKGEAKGKDIFDFPEMESDNLNSASAKEDEGWDI